MKKIKFSGNLNLNKEVVSRLNDEEMSGAIGGKKIKPTDLPHCGELTHQAACRTGRLCETNSVSILCFDGGGTIVIGG